MKRMCIKNSGEEFTSAFLYQHDKNDEMSEPLNLLQILRIVCLLGGGGGGVILSSLESSIVATKYLR